MLNSSIRQTFIQMFKENIDFFMQSSSLGIILIVFIVIIFAYFLPSIIAIYRKHQVLTVLILNTLLGFTFIGRIIALAISV